MKTTDSRARVAISKPVYLRAWLLINDVNLMQLIVLCAARVAYSLCYWSIDAGRLGKACDVERRREERNDGRGVQSVALRGKFCFSPRRVKVK
jgi:hypothetical protein